MADQVLKNSKGIIIGKIRERSGKLEILNPGGAIKGNYDPKRDETRDNTGRIIGKGNLLATLL